MLKSVKDRLFEKIDQSGGPDSCWPWMKGRGVHGYGYMYANGKTRKAHALVLEVVTEEKANGRLALHKCDNPPCCNPRHLYWGTPQQNVRDRDKRGRQVALKGESHGCSRLTHDQVLEIRNRHIPRDPVNGGSALGREFGVHTSTIHLIVKGKHWASV